MKCAKRVISGSRKSAMMTDGIAEVVWIEGVVKGIEIVGPQATGWLPLDSWVLV